MSFSNRKKSVIRQKSLRFESLENRELLSINPAILGDFGITAVSEDRFEPNDTIAEVAQCVPGATDSPNLGKITGTTVLENLTLTTGDVDWFRFELSTVGGADNYINILADEGDMDLYLYSVDGRRLRSSAEWYSDESISLEGLFPGVYYIGVEEYSESEISNYTLTINTPAVPNSVTSGVYQDLHGDALFVQGTDGADWIEIEETTTQIIVHSFSANGQTEIDSQGFAKTGIVVIRFNGSGGDDTFKNSYNGVVGSIDCYLEGGDGDDLLVGGLGSDTIYGGAGNDMLDGGLGNNILVGGGGANTFYASGVGSSVYAWTGSGDQWASGFDTRSDGDAHLIFGVTDREGNTSDNFDGATLNYVPWTDSDIADVLSIVSDVYEVTRAYDRNEAGSYKFFQNTYFADKSVYLVLTDNYDGLGNVYGYNGYGVDVLFRANAVNSRLTIHEFGHFWNYGNDDSGWIQQVNPFYDEFCAISWDGNVQKADAVDGDFAFGKDAAYSPAEDWAQALSLNFDGLASNPSENAPTPTAKWYQKAAILNRFALWLAEESPSAETPTGFNDNDFQKLYAAGLIDADGNTLVGTITWSDDAEKRVTEIDVNSTNLRDSLNLSGCTELTSLDCSYNMLTALNVSDCAALTELYCRYNNLTALDISANTALTILCCDGNNFSILDVSHLTGLMSLSCDGLGLTSLDVSSNAALRYLYCNNNRLTSLDISANTALEILKCTGNSFTFASLPSGSGLAEYDYSWMQSIPIGTEVGDQMQISRVGFNELVSQFGAGGGDTTYKWWIYNRYSANVAVDSGQITENNGVFTFAEELAGKTVYCEMTNTAFPGLTLVTDHAVVDYTGITYNDNDQTKVTAAGLDDYATWKVVGTERRLVSIYAWNVSDLSSNIDLSGCTALESVTLGYCDITSLNLTGCEKLESVSCVGNQLTFASLILPDGFSGSLNVGSYTFIEIGTDGVITRNDFNELVGYQLDDGSTEYTWYVRDIEADPDASPESHVIDPLLVTNVNGVFSFDISLAGRTVYCVMTNDNFSDWTIGTNDVKLDYSDITAYNTAEKNMVDYLYTFEVIDEEYGSSNIEVDWVYDTVSDEMRLARLGIWNTESAVAPLDFSGFDFLVSLDLYNIGLGSLTLADCTSLVYLDCSKNNLTSLDCTELASLEILYCSQNNLTSLTLTGCVKLNDLWCPDNQLATLDISDCTELVWFGCSGNQLSSINFDNNTKLVSLSLGGTLYDYDYDTGNSTEFPGGNNFTTLDLSMLTALEYLEIAYNPLTSLNLSGLTELSYIIVSDNLLTELNLTGLINLDYIYVSNNQLTELNLTGVSNVYGLDCSGNKLTFSALPPKNFVERDYHYDNQSPVSITNDEGSVDLSSEYSVNGTLTTYTWYYENGGAVATGLVTENNGVFTFDADLNGSRVYCKMENDGFPDLVLETTVVYVGDEAGLPPENFRTTVAGRQALTIEWNAVENAAEYLLQRKGPGDADYIDVYSGENLRFVDEGLESGIAYSYRLLTVYDDGQSAFVSLDTQTASPTDADVPMFTDVSFDPQSGAATVMWTPIDGAFYVLFKNNMPLIQNLTTNSFVDPNPGDQDMYMVFSYTREHKWQSAVPYLVTSLPKAEIVSHEFVSGGLRLDWADTGTGYVLFRNNAAMTPVSSDRTFLDKTVEPGETYYYTLYSYSRATGWILSDAYTVTIPSGAQNLAFLDAVWSDESLTSLEDLSVI